MLLLCPYLPVSGYDETDNKLLTLESWGNQTSVDSRNNYLYLGVGTYYVRVQRDQYSHSAADYILTVNFTENIGQFEIESNVSKTTATEMNVDKAITGNLYNGNDVDFYKFHLSAPGRVSLNFRHRNLENDRRYWWIDVFDETDNKLLTLESWGNQISVDSSRNNYLYLGVGTYYVRVQRDQFSHSAADYILTVNFTENIGQFEIESNASKTTATAMIVNKAITGNLYNDSDVDWYKFTLAGQNEVFLNFKHDNLENDSRYWWIDVFDETGDVILTMDSNGKNTVKNSGKISIGTGTYNVRVQRDQYSHSTSNYTMIVVTDAPTYTISASPASLNFGTVQTPYTQPAVQTVTVTNTGTGSVTLNALPTVPNWTLTPGANWTTAMAAGQTRTLTIRPNAGLAAGTYNPTITISGSNGVSATVSASFTVTVPVDYKISASPSPISFGSLQSPYTQPAAQTVTVTNTGTGSVTLNALPTVANWTLTPGANWTTAMAAGQTRTFTIRPNAGLAAGTYNPTITISGSNGASATVRASFTVIEAPIYGISLTPSGNKIFDAATMGYGAQTAHSVTVNNTGNQSTGNLTVALSGANAGSFTLSTTSINSIAVGGSSSFTVRPNTGLAAGTYTATVTLSGTNITARNFTVSFTVKPQPTVTIGTCGTLTAGVAGTVTCSVTTTGIANGAYAPNVANLPTGVSVSGNVTITNNSGTLMLSGNTSTVAGTYKLRLTIDGTLSNEFTLSTAQIPGTVGDFPALRTAIDNCGTAPGGMVITVTRDISITAGLIVPSACTITIRSANAANPARLTLRRGDFIGYPFIVSSGAKLILEDIIVDGNKDGNDDYPSGRETSLVGVNGGEFIMNAGAILTNNDNRSKNLLTLGGGVHLSKGTFTMTGGEISGNSASYGGGVGGFGVFTMTGGKISGNYAGLSGGGVYVGGEFTMTGGEISGNSAYSDGGGVYLSDEGVFTMTGGEISGNTARYAGGGVYGVVTLGGMAVVSGNTSDNVYLTSGKYITLSTVTPPAPGMNVGVRTSSSNGVIVQSGARAGDTAYFHADESGKAVVFENNQLVIRAVQYTIIASPSPLSFGSLQSPYTQPAAQTVTITNTGAGSVTLNALPAVANWTLTPGANWTTAMAAGQTRTFTIRPNAGLVAGTYNPTITISGTGGTSATVSASFTVTPVVALASIAVTTPPTKTVYTVGETLNIAGMIVTATYSDGSKKAVTGFTTNPAAGAILSAAGTPTVTVSYAEGGVTKNGSFTITVNPVPVVALASIAVTTPPTKTVYTVGEALNLAGMIVTATYSDGSKKAVTGFTTNPTAGAILSAAGTPTIAVSYAEGGVTKAVSFNVTVNSPVTVSSSVAAIATGDDFTVVLYDDGSLWTWGLNGHGQLGDGTTTNRNIPVQFGNDKDWVAISAGSNHTVAMKENGSLWAWGKNDYGQLGNGAWTNSSIPVQIGTDRNWVAISAGGQHTMALKANGSLWAWGLNDHGQLGNGTNTNRNTPVQIGTDTNWAAISGGGVHSAALKSDGSLWLWGQNDYGQLGNGTYTSRNTPVQLGTDRDWVEVSAAGERTMALKANGSLWAWGANWDGQIGDGTYMSRSTPVQVGTDRNWDTISAGGYHTAALKTDGSLWVWGGNQQGQLGNGTNAGSAIPVRLGTDRDWLDVSAGHRHTVALKADGSLWTWGWNTSGQLGDGSLADRKVPVKIISADTDNPVEVIEVRQSLIYGSYYFAPVDLLGSGYKYEIISRPGTLGGLAPWINIYGQFEFAHQAMPVNISREGRYVVKAYDNAGNVVAVYSIIVLQLYLYY